MRNHAQADEKPKMTVEDAFRVWHKGLTSKKMEDQEKALRAILPAKKDIEHLFPKQAAKLWPKLQKWNTHLLENVDKVAAEFREKVAIKKIRAVDVRKDKKSEKQYKRVFAMIPKDIPVFELDVTMVKVTGHSAAYLYVNKRWIWIDELDSILELLDEK
jgi:hypothetical protein